MLFLAVYSAQAIFCADNCSPDPQPFFDMFDLPQMVCDLELSAVPVGTLIAARYSTRYAPKRSARTCLYPDGCRVAPRWRASSPLHYFDSNLAASPAWYRHWLNYHRLSYVASVGHRGVSTHWSRCFCSEWDPLPLVSFADWSNLFTSGVGLSDDWPEHGYRVTSAAQSCDSHWICVFDDHSCSDSRSLGLLV